MTMKIERGKTMVKENGMVMMTEEEFNKMQLRISNTETEKDQMVLDYERRLELMQIALMDLSRAVSTVSQDVRVPKADFIAMHSTAVAEMDGCEDNDIYGYDITVHWHGFYCNCGDGATPSNYIIPGIEDCNEEDPTEY